MGVSIRSERGRGGSTWAQWQIALAYVKYLSHDFHRFVKTTTGPRSISTRGSWST